MLISGAVGVLLFLSAAYGLQAFQHRNGEPSRFRQDLAILAILAFLLLFLAYLARSHCS